MIRSTLFIPISRGWLLPAIGRYLLSQELPEDIELILFLDNKNIRDEARQFIKDVGGKFAQVHLYDADREPLHDEADVPLRRQRICDIWNIARTLPAESSKDFYGLEDDTLPPDGAYKRLSQQLADDSVGFVSGVEAGRWGFKIVGAWYIDEHRVMTVPYQKEGIVTVQGAGLYCFGTRTSSIRNHTFHYEAECLGPDVCYVREVSQSKRCTVDFGINCAHVTLRGETMFVDDECVSLEWKIENAAYVPIF